MSNDISAKATYSMCFKNFILLSSCTNILFISVYLDGCACIIRELIAVSSVGRYQRMRHVRYNFYIVFMHTSNFIACNK